MCIEELLELTVWPPTHPTTVVCVTYIIDIYIYIYIITRGRRELNFIQKGVFSG